MGRKYGPEGGPKIPDQGCTRNNTFPHFTSTSDIRCGVPAFFTFQLEVVTKNSNYLAYLRLS